MLISATPSPFCFLRISFSLRNAEQHQQQIVLHNLSFLLSFLMMTLIILRANCGTVSPAYIRKPKAIMRIVELSM